MYDILCKYVMRVRMPVRWAALRARFSVCCRGLHIVGLMSKRSGAAYVNLVLMSVLYSKSAMRGGMFLCVL